MFLFCQSRMRNERQRTQWRIRSGINGIRTFGRAYSVPFKIQENAPNSPRSRKSMLSFRKRLCIRLMSSAKKHIIESPMPYSLNSRLFIERFGPNSSSNFCQENELPPLLCSRRASPVGSRRTPAIPAARAEEGIYFLKNDFRQKSAPSFRYQYHPIAANADMAK